MELSYQVRWEGGSHTSKGVTALCQGPDHRCGREEATVGPRPGAWLGCGLRIFDVS